MLINAIAVVTSIATTAFLSRGRISGFYFGEIFDTRLMIVLHEHWFRFFSGKTAFLDAEFFYPYPRSFALTDTFLLTGITHSLFRTLSVDIVDAWYAAQIIWIFIGLLGWFFFAKTFLSNKTLQILIIPLIGSSFPFVAHLHERPNVIPYLLSSWIFFFIFKFYQSNSKTLSTNYLGLILIFIPLIVLTSWYAGFFIVIYLFVLIIFLGLFDKFVLARVFNQMISLNHILLAPYLITSLVLTGLWAFIYLPELENSANTTRPISEVEERSPSLGTIFFNSSLDGSRIFNFFPSQYQIGQENLIGISFILSFSIFLLFVILYLSRKRNLREFLPRVLFIFLISGLFIEFIILKITDYSIFMYIFEEISFIRSIRAPVRWHIYLTFLFIVVLLYLMNQVLQSSKSKTRYLLFVIPILILFDQYRTGPGLWQRDEFLNENLLPYKNQLENCSAFVLDRPDTGLWLDMIESLPLTTIVNASSVLGYSGSRPKDFPDIYWFNDGDLFAIGEWLKSKNKLKNTCFLDGINYERILKYTPERVDFSLGRGFTGLEKSKNSSWAWSVWESSSFYLHSFLNTPKNVNLNFYLEIPDCINSGNFVIRINEQRLNIIFEKENSKNISIDLTVDAWQRQEIQITKDSGFCTSANDPRELHFSIKDVKITQQ